MRNTGDRYFKEQKLYDIRVLSTLGITDKDIEDIRKIDTVTAVTGAHTKEVLVGEADNQKVVKMISMTTGVNEVNLKQGRLPENERECVLDFAVGGYKVGDTIKIESGTSDPIEDSMNITEFTVVGIGALPYYIDLTRGVGSIGGGSLSGFALVEDSAFNMDVYTEVYVQVAGADKYNSYSDQYQEVIDETKDKIEALEDKICQRRLDEVKAEANEKIADGEKEVEDGLAELEDARQQLEDAKLELEDGKKELDDAETELIDGKAELDDAKVQLDDGKKTLDDSKAQIDAGKAELDEGQEELIAAKIELDDARLQLDEAKAEIDAGQIELDAGKQVLDASKAELDAGRIELDAAKQQLEDGKAQLDASKTELDNNQAALDLAFAKYDLDAETLANDWADFYARGGSDPDEYIALATRQAILDGTKTFLDDSQSKLDAGYAQYEAGLALYETNYVTYIASENAYAEGLAQYEAGLALYNENLEKFNAGKAEYEAGLAKYNEGLAQYEDGLSKWLTGYSSYAEGLAQWEEGLAKYEDSLSQYNEGVEKYEDGLAKWEDGKKEYEDGLTEYLDGEKEYQEAYDENMPKIEDAQVDLAKAREDVADIKMPELYVLDRDTISSVVSFGQDGDRMDSLGNVFPVVFFLVAALVSLTAMTRMVDEQRQQIGTLKALGFGGGTIALKYIKYAMIPTVIGGIIGVFVGEKSLPWVIVEAYKMMYSGIEKTVLTMNWTQGILAVAAAVLCIGIATMAACYGKLREKPAEIMRPEAPKSGKRVLLEYVTPIWKRLNFTQKSTIRNLFRYKKRLFMTIIGIGACMGIVLVGFGIQDSIKDVAKRQFKEIFMDDASVTINLDATEAEKEHMFETVRAIPEIDDQMELYNVNVTLKNGNVERAAAVFVPKELDEVFNFVRFQDRVTRKPYDFPLEGVALSEKTADMLGVGIGDTIIIQKGEIGDEIKAEVSLIVENYVQHYCFMTKETYEKLWGEEPEYNKLVLKFDESIEGINDKIGSILLDEKACSSISFSSEFQHTIDTMLSTLGEIIWVLIIAGGLLAFVVIYNLNNINITERKRELATLKVLGFRDMEVAMYVYRENLILTLLGIVIGCFIGTVLHRFTIITVEVDLMMFGRNIAPSSYLISAAITVVFAIIVNAVMYFSLKKIDMIESLKSVE